ncbi:MAG: tetratricopeptide repeat protein [Psychroflexus sp.]|nr:tetratricopeptide repeat protein [Psychroflexus sp.]
MYRNFIISGLLVFFFSLTSQAQQTEAYVNPVATYQKALTLYQNEQYQAAQKIFGQLQNDQPDEQLQVNSQYYYAVSAIKRDQQGSEELMEDFVNQHPTSSKRNTAYVNVADYYFRIGNYNKASKWYNQVSKGNLSRDEVIEYYFNFAYASFKSGNKKRARKYFERVRDNRTYGSQAKYYIGFMAYEDDDYQQASRNFEQVKTDEPADKNLSYFQSDMNFKLGNFKKAIQLAKEQLPKSNYREKSELNKIIGESYFNLEQYEQAIPYLEKYEGKRGKWNNTDYYQLGYAYYQQANYQKAIASFNKIINGKNFVAQNAYYHLAQAYLKSGKKTEALNAFKNASEMPYNKKIKKDAYFNYAKLSFEIGNTYASVPEVLQSYLKQYPNSEGADEISQLLIEAYVNSDDYESALDLLTGSSQYEEKKRYQKIAYEYGIELFKDDQYKKADNYLNKSLQERVDDKYTALATFWKAESAYQQARYDEAVIGFKEFKGLPKARQTEIYQQIDYQLGYAYFKKQNYKSAEKHFGNFKATTNQESLRHDALIRLGDTHFAQGDYWPAMEAYNDAKAIPNFRSDYAFYQKAISYGFVERNGRKIEELEKFLQTFDQSIYRDDAIYQLANTYIAENQSNKGINTYKRLTQEYPNSRFVPKALSKQALVEYNSGDNRQALAIFKQLVKDYQNTDEALDAVQTVREIYIDLGEPEAYAGWVKKLDFVNIDNEEIDKTTFQSAEKSFINGDKNKAITGFRKYLDQFPKGRYALDSHFYLAQMLYNQEKYEQAQPHYQYVINQPKNNFTEESLSRLSEVYLKQNTYSSAIPLLERLEQSASFTQNVLFAQTNLMKAYYKTKQYEKAIDYGKDVLNEKSIDKSIKSDAHVFIARSAMKLDRKDLARSSYENVETFARGERKAEALYFKALFLNENGEYKESNKVVQDITKNYSNYKKYSYKSLVLMADNFYSLNDSYQANYILENIIQKTDDYPEVKQAAEELQATIKQEAAKTNSSVEAEEAVKDTINKN